MSAITDMATRRYIFGLLRSIAATIGSACLLAATLPRLDLAWLALPASAGLLWSWQRRSRRDAMLLGFIAGMVYFSLAYRWFGETAGSAVGWFAPILVLGPALLSAWTFAVAALGQWTARKYGLAALSPLATALAFTFCEGLRSLGPLANPFAQIGYPQVNTPIGQLAAFVGGGGVTLAVMYGGGLIAELVARPTKPRASFIGAGILGALILAANVCAPARFLEQPTTPVAIVQGNIRQQLKWVDGALEKAVERYSALTQSIGSDAKGDGAHPRFVLWPETVIPTDLAAEPALQARFRSLAGSLNTTLIIGSLERRNAIPYNTLWFIDRTGIVRIYRKRKLVPFAETLPGAALLHFIPLTRLVSQFGSGTEATVVPIGERRVAPLICWESEFPELLTKQVANGGDVFLVSTDDAWFGESDGPYQHAQIAQMRAIETGRWLVRSAATGISGIIAPNGQFTDRSVINTIAVLRGHVGNAVDTPFNHVGVKPLLALMGLGYGVILGLGLRQKRRASGT